MGLLGDGGAPIACLAASTDQTPVMPVDIQVERYSDESARRLRAATEELTAALQRFTEETALMHGGTAEHRAFEALCSEVERTVVAWQERAEEHSGQSILPLDDELVTYTGDEDDEDDEEDDDPDEVLGPVAALSVVSRWDLQVTDSELLIASGRQAHRRSNSEEDEQDTAEAVADVASALQAVLHEHGEPWYSIAGVDVISGARVFLAPDVVEESAAGLEADAADPDADDAEVDEGDLEDWDSVTPVMPPTGTVIFSEGWG